MRYTVNAEQFLELPVTTGTVQNISNTDIEVSNEEVVGSGLILKAGEMVGFNNATVYVCARPVLEGGTGIISVVPFSIKGEGGGGGSYVLPIASKTVLGGVKSSDTVGKIKVDGMGVMTYNAPEAQPLEAPEWAENTAYTVNALVEHNDDVYMCLVAHTSTSDFDADLAGGKWKLVGLALKVATTTQLGGVKANDADGGVSVASDGKMTYNPLGYRQPSTAYAVGAIAYHSALPTGWCLECKTAGTSGSGELTISSPAIGNTVTDGTVTWKIGMPLSLNGGTMTGSILHKDSEWFNIYGGQSSTVASGIIQLGSPAVDGRVNIIAKGADSTGELLAYPDGRLKWNGNDIVALYPNAAAHNSIYRGKDLTAYFDSGDMSTAIANGSFKDIYPGDYIIKSITIDGTTYSNVKFIIMDLDYHLHCGDTETTAHHVVIMPEEQLGTAQMNTENTAAGGYSGSKMWTEHMPKVVAGFEAAFGAAHILEHRELLSNAMDANLKPNGYNNWSGAASGWAWASVKANLANENMVYGAPIVSSSFFDTGECNSQLAAFRLNHGLICSKRYWWWLRSVANVSNFCAVSDYGSADNNAAAYSGGVRPYFLYK